MYTCLLKSLILTLFPLTFLWRMSNLMAPVSSMLDCSFPTLLDFHCVFGILAFGPACSQSHFPFSLSLCQLVHLEEITSREQPGSCSETLSPVERDRLEGLRPTPLGSRAEAGAPQGRASQAGSPHLPCAVGSQMRARHPAKERMLATCSQYRRV